jgi:GDSL-like Lipase/Acylhydrolase family
VGRPGKSLPARSFPAARRVPKSAVAFLLVALAFAAAELVCRWGLGLGDPPLYQADPAMEYLLRPSRVYSRFHHRFAVNRYSMRADDFPPRKSSPNELRVLVIGDSVIYGGVRVDQEDIDTEILKRDLQRQLGRPVVVGNASAKSWGPPNELAYLQRFGTLDSDVVVLELSSHDYADAPTFAPVVGIAAEYPGRRPRLALADLFETYILPRYFGFGVTPAGIDRTAPDTAPSDADVAECREAERNLFRLARAKRAKVALVQHLSLPELTGKYQAGYAANQQVAKEENVPYVDDGNELRTALTSGHSPFYAGDSLHLNQLGQEVLAHTLQRAVDLALNRK